MRDYRGADLDELLAAGAIVWTGSGAIGSTDGRIRLYWREQLPLLAPTPSDEPPDGPIHDALRTHLDTRGASFGPELFSASGAPDEAAVLVALWDLVWAGEVTNDTFGPVRGLLAGSGGRKRRTRGVSRGGRPRPGQLTRLGPPQASGRWSLVAPLLEPRPSDTERSHLQALQLLERHGVLTREGTLGEQHPGGFAAVYGLLRALEERGQVRRGYFVAGLGGAQFATPGSVDRLRDHRERPEIQQVVALGAADPAQPYGASLVWPQSAGRPARVAGGHVVLADGHPLIFLDRGARSVATFDSTLEDPAWVGALIQLACSGRVSAIEIQKIDGEPALGHPVSEMLVAYGFRPGFKGPTFRS